MTDTSGRSHSPEPTPSGARVSSVAEIIYSTHGCSCEAHYSQGEVASCQAWRRRAANDAAVRLLAEYGCEP